MNSKTKKILIVVLLVGIISITIAYAVLSQTLNISGSAQLQNRSASWNIHFTPITSGTAIDSHGYASVANNASIDLSNPNTTATLPEVTLNAPGDYVDFYFDVINEGDVTGYLNIINNINIPSPSYANKETLTSEQRTALEAAITGTITDSNGNELTLNSSLAKNARLNLRVRISFDSNASILPSQNVTFSDITASLVYGQDTVSQGGNSGGNEPVTPTGNYTYYIADPNSDGLMTTDTYDSSWEAYIRQDTNGNYETCGTYPSGTVCLTSSYYNSNYSSAGNYNADFADVSTAINKITTISGLQATGLKGYSLSKAEEMLSKGAFECYVGRSGVNCNIPSGGLCEIYGYGFGSVSCYDGSYIFYVDSDDVSIDTP